MMHLELKYTQNLIVSLQFMEMYLNITMKQS